MDPFVVYLVGLLAVALIGWLWLEWRWAMDQLRLMTAAAETARDMCQRAIESGEEAVAQRNRAIDFAAGLAEAIEQAGGPGVVMPRELDPSRRTGPGFRTNGSHLRSVE